MEDDEIIKLYWNRDERAIPATAAQYGAYCTSIAHHILGDRSDADECVNDTYLKTWNVIPPQRPRILSAFLGKITRNLALDRYRQNHTAKRGGGQLPAVLDELEDCVSGKEEPEDILDRKELAKALHDFLSELSPEKRGIFICRYWYTESISEIAKRYHLSSGAAAMQLSRLRNRLRTFLTERGIEI